MKIEALEISPVLSLDPELICAERADAGAFRDVMRGTALAHEPSYGSSALYKTAHLLGHIQPVTDALFIATNSSRDSISLLGGYAFFDGDRFLFGGEHAFPFYQDWDRGFRLIADTSPVEIHVDGHATKLMRRDDELIILRGADEFQAPVAEFLRQTSRAMKANQDFRQALAWHLRARIGESRRDVWEQLS